MSVLAILGIVLGSAVLYILIGVATSAILQVKFDADDADSQLVGALWLLSIPFLVVIRYGGFILYKLHREFEYRLNKDTNRARHEREKMTKAAKNLPKATARKV